MNDSSNDKYEEDSDEDEVTFMSRKIGEIWRNQGGSRWKNSSWRVPKEKKDNDKSFIIFYEYKKPRHLKFECPELEKGQDKKKHYKTKEKRILWVLEKILTTLRLTKIINGDAPSKESEFDQEDEVNFNVPEFLKILFSLVL